MVRIGVYLKIKTVRIVAFVAIFFLATSWLGSATLTPFFSNIHQTIHISAQNNACGEFQCTRDTQDEDEYLSCIRNKQACLQERIAETRSTQNTLTQTLSIIRNQISVQELQIEQTQSEIATLNRQIDRLTDRIAGLNVSLDNLSSVLVKRVGEHYKRQSTNPILTLLTRGNINTAVSEYKYLQHAQEQTARAMQLAEAQRITYDEQKLLLEETQEELSQTQTRLENQQQSLAQQRNEQTNLLEVTRNDERRYQQLLEEANRQLAAFRRFVNLQGGASLLTNQTKCDDWGCYYSQRDSQWGAMGIGASSSSMAEYGCLVTAMAMIASHNGKDLRPSTIAAANNVFVTPTAFMIQGTWSVAGVSMSRTVVGYGANALDAELSRGEPVIVGIGAGPDHFVVITEKKDGKYLMHDPFIENGQYLDFASRYSLNSIRVDRVRVF